MRQEIRDGTNNPRHKWLLGMLPVVFLSLMGCRGLLQDTQESVSDFVYRPDPIRVVKTEKSADRRAKFLGQITEPARNGGSQAEQDEAVNILVTTATTDPFPTCRLRAIRTLGTFEDPRAVQGLQTAYYKTTGFSPRINNLIKQQTMESLGKTGSPEAKRILIQVARAAAQEKDSLERQLTLDERLAAIRSMSKYKNDPEVSAALVQILKTDRDVAVRKRATEALQTVSGQRVAPETFQPPQEQPQRQTQTVGQPTSDGNVTTVSHEETSFFQRMMRWPWQS